MLKSGVELIACGANVPFADKEIFYGPISELADTRMSVIPDFIANCGMARVFAYLMGDGDVDLSDDAIFSDTSATIRAALKEVRDTNQGDKLRLSERALEIALKKLI
jgi:glutamate dehydrogenase/leucine dehydrogenase